MNYLQKQSVHKAVQRAALVVLALLLTACSSQQQSAEPAQLVVSGDPRAGVLAIQTYGCGTCHSIPGVAGANAMVGPPLDEWAERRYISGNLPNQPEILIEWIRFPQAIEPGNAMPNMGVTEQGARDISAYLYSLSGD